MTASRRLPRPALAALALLPLVWLSASRTATTPARPDAARVVGPRACAECHEEENRTWLATAHHEGFRTLARTPEAREMTRALGIRRLKTDARCVRCHFTEQSSADAEPEVIDGVSCESCHGAAAGWIDVHSDFGGEGRTPATEEPEHRAERLARCAEAGMRGPSNVHALLAGCYECHFVADPELFAAGHRTGDGFELLSATQGEVRHHFVRGAGVNVEAPVERRRVLFLVGRVLEVEFGLRRLADLAESGPLSEAVRARALAARGHLAEASERAELAPLASLLTVLPPDDAWTAGGQGLAAAADAASDVARRLLMEVDGAGLEALDELVARVSGGEMR